LFPTFHLVGVPASIVNLTTLTSLNLANNFIKTVEALRGLVNLTSLDPQSNDIRDISSLVSLRNLQKRLICPVAKSIMMLRHSGCFRHCEKPSLTRRA
jgi:Leucine-rich repeat (LRR) protein